MSEGNLKEIEQLKQSLRQKRNTAQAGLFLAVIVAVLSAAWLYIQGELQAQISHEAGEVVVNADSLNQIKSKLQEQELHIQTQDNEIARLREVMSQEQNDPSSAEIDESSDTEEEDDSQAKNTIESSSESIHVIEAGETLWGISVKYFNDGHRNLDLASSNGITDASLIIVGQTLRLY